MALFKPNQAHALDPASFAATLQQAMAAADSAELPVANPQVQRLLGHLPPVAPQAQRVLLALAPLYANPAQYFSAAYRFSALLEVLGRGKVAAWQENQPQAARFHVSLHLIRAAATARITKTGKFIPSELMAAATALRDADAAGDQAEGSPGA